MILPSHCLAGKRILVVEDEALIAMETAYVLHESGAFVTGPCSTAREALAVLRGTTVLDAAVLDVDLGHGNRIDAVAEALLSQGIPFVFQTGCNRSELPSCCPEARMSDKPVSAERLTSLLTQAMMN